MIRTYFVFYHMMHTYLHKVHEMKIRMIQVSYPEGLWSVLYHMADSIIYLSALRFCLCLCSFYHIISTLLHLTSNRFS